MATKPQSSTKPTLENKNVASGQLAFFAKGTSFYRDGYCRSGPDDQENTSIAASVTEDFLNSSGKDLQLQGAQPGSKWCLSTRLWKEVFDAAQKGSASKTSVPRVHLHATHEKALQDLSYKDLKAFEAEREVPSLRGRRDEHSTPESGGGIAKETTDVGGDMGTTAPGNFGKMATKKTDAR